MRRSNGSPKSVKRFTLLIKSPVYGVIKQNNAGLVVGISRFAGYKCLDW